MTFPFPIACQLHDLLVLFPLCEVLQLFGVKHVGKEPISLDEAVPMKHGLVLVAISWIGFDAPHESFVTVKQFASWALSKRGCSIERIVFRLIACILPGYNPTILTG